MMLDILHVSCSVAAHDAHKLCAHLVLVVHAPDLGVQMAEVT